ncbi:MAG: CPBP family intramembrane metalloprotease [Solobacterium sp.]|nr:CPBP family intramembrane metalloprotease [Solobacterium sp.]
MISNTSSLCMSILLMILMKVWYSPQYQGTLKSGLPLKLTLLVMVPMVIKSVVVLVIQLFQYSFWFDPSFFNIIKALAAGFWEECVFRLTVIPIAMGFIKTEKKIWLVPVISGLIFGIMHMVNIKGGASVSNTLIQALVTSLDGFFYGALFVVTGSAFPGIILHSAYDFICFAGDKSLTNGIMTTNLQTWEIIFNIVLSLIVCAGGVRIIRKVGNNKILSVWRKKWSQKADAIQG